MVFSEALLNFCMQVYKQLTQLVEYLAYNEKVSDLIPLLFKSKQMKTNKIESLTRLMVLINFLQLLLRKLQHKLKLLLLVNLPRLTKNYIIGLIASHIIWYPSPISLTYAWSFGSLAGICLVIQMISGIFLAMHYCPNIYLAFSSVEFIMRDINSGWLIRYIHANGASMFFILVYSHILCRGLYYGSYIKPRELLWCSGVVLFLLMMATAFTGYVLPWGQMSLWGATVITSMVTAVPIAGQSLVEWLWGAYTVGNATLNRFFSIHFFLPFLIAGVSLIHLVLLHKVGSSSPLGSENGVDDVSFHPYFSSKDMFAFFCFMLFFATFVFYLPNVLNHPDNYIPADSLKTPAHVVPEWYFLTFYAILRSIPYKTAGILAMIGAIIILFPIPSFTTSYIKNTTYRPMFKFGFWFFLAVFIILIWVGQKPVKKTFVFVGQVATVCYFIFFLFLIPLIGIIEKKFAFYPLENLAYLNLNRSKYSIKMDKTAELFLIMFLRISALLKQIIETLIISFDYFLAAILRILEIITKFTHSVHRMISPALSFKTIIKFIFKTGVFTKIFMVFFPMVPVAVVPHVIISVMTDYSEFLDRIFQFFMQLVSDVNEKINIYLTESLKNERLLENVTQLEQSLKSQKEENIALKKQIQDQIDQINQMQTKYTK